MDFVANGSNIDLDLVAFKTLVHIWKHMARGMVANGSNYWQHSKNTFFAFGRKWQHLVAFNTMVAIDKTYQNLVTSKKIDKIRFGSIYKDLVASDRYLVIIWQQKKMLQDWVAFNTMEANDKTYQNFVLKKLIKFDMVAFTKIWQQMVDIQ